MTKKEFLKRIEEEKPDTGGFGFIVDGIQVIKGGPALLECRHEQNKWKIVAPLERGGESIRLETTSEDEAFNQLYETVKREERLSKN